MTDTKNTSDVLVVLTPTMVTFLRERIEVESAWGEDVYTAEELAMMADAAARLTDA